MSKPLSACLCLMLLSTASAQANETEPLRGDTHLHPIMSSKWWLTGGWFLADRDLKASAGANFGPLERQIDFEGSAGVEDASNLVAAELGWQFGKEWGLALQHFRSERTGSRALQETLVWQGVTYEADVRLDAKSHMEVTRIFLSRRFRDKGAHSLRIGAGVHWLDMGVEVAGEATLGDGSTGFTRSVASASLPVPNIGAWYRFSPSRRWIINARVDWLSASIDNFSGGIWNVSAGGAFALTDNVGVGASYQLFELNGDLTEPNWYGYVKTSYSGPYLYLSGYW